MPRRPFHEPYPLGVLGTPELILEPSRGWGEVGRKERKKIKQFSPLLPHLRLGSLRTLPPTLSRFPLPFGKWVSFQAFHSPKSNQISSASPSNQRKCLENGVTSITKDSQTGNPEPGNPDIFKKTQVKSCFLFSNLKLLGNADSLCRPDACEDESGFSPFSVSTLSKLLLLQWLLLQDWVLQIQPYLNEEQKEVWGKRQRGKKRRKKSEIKANRRGKERGKKKHTPPNKLSGVDRPLQKKKKKKHNKGEGGSEKIRKTKSNNITQLLWIYIFHRFFFKDDVKLN